MTIVINRVTTKVGDSGTTRLAGGQEVSKDDPRIEAYGALDELNAVLGVLIERLRDDQTDQQLVARLSRVQNEIFDLGGELAVLPQDRHPQQSLVSSSDIDRLEHELDEVNAELPTLRSFVLPRGAMAVALFHLARTVCRRAERALVTLSTAMRLPFGSAGGERHETLVYLNRLSDWLFVMSRKAAKDAGVEEVLWRPGDRR
ncbi:MAG: cob(I)yrinic acid a,c-diamide adenosyltransferase [Deltaproteobacteria bacterium]|nr:cob(I)yrinic acid a,c-diamide adenosyltransferase [Deltaproteobacteria bacterium]